MAKPGISTVGALLGYTTTTATTKPASYKKLTRINAIGGINIDVEEIDASALEDEIEKSIAGRGTTGGNYTITVNLTDDTLTEWETLISAYNTVKTNGYLWMETYFPSLSKGVYVVCQPPSKLPQPEVGQNGLLTAEINMTINEYKGWDTAIIPS